MSGVNEALQKTLCEIFQQNTGTLTKIDLQKITSEPDEGIQYLNAIANKNNLINILEDIDINEIQ